MAKKRVSNEKILKLINLNEKREDALFALVSVILTTILLFFQQLPDARLQMFITGAVAVSVFMVLLIFRFEKIIETAYRVSIFLLIMLVVTFSARALTFACSSNTFCLMKLQDIANFQDLSFSLLLFYFVFQPVLLIGAHHADIIKFLQKIASSLPRKAKNLWKQTIAQLYQTKDRRLKRRRLK